LITGFLGGFTTFSAFALDAVTLFERGASLALMAYLILSIAATIAAAFAGIGLMRSLL
jgi:CrcB protein